MPRPKPWNTLNVNLVVPYDNRFAPDLLAELLEKASYGLRDMNRVLIEHELIVPLHPYDSLLDIEYDRDNPGREVWSNAAEVIRKKKGDCEDLSNWLAAWYQEILGWDAKGIIYQTRETAAGYPGYHVVVMVKPPIEWLEKEGPVPPYDRFPYGDMDSVILAANDEEGWYVEDPSIALGMLTLDRGPRIFWDSNEHTRTSFHFHIDGEFLP